MSKPQEQEVGIATKWIDSILKASLTERASDIHIDPRGKEMVTRFRIDGVMRKVNTQPITYHPSIISRLKVLANLSTVETKIPQDGHIEVILNMSDTKLGVEAGGGVQKLVNFRMSVMPTAEGEAAVLRTLNREESVMGLEELGFSKNALGKVKKVLRRTTGIFLLTGPNASGKTTTLYSVLNTYNVEEKNVITLEDPVEYQFLKFRQTQIAPKQGYTFAVGLKAILRQDPDIIMIGEIRDKETVDIAVSAALTGRLVFSTFHAPDIIGVIIRLLEMGIGKAMIASALTGVVAERLVRKICTHCKVEASVPEDLLKLLGIKWPGGQVYKGKGCEACSGTGFFGRIGIFEVLEVNDQVKNLILQQTTPDIMKEHIEHEITESMITDGFEKVQKGITTIEEVIKVAV